jgi:hypothetical protein
MPSKCKPLLILIAVPYRPGTNGAPCKRALFLRGV